MWAHLYRAVNTPLFDYLLEVMGIFYGVSLFLSSTLNSGGLEIQKALGQCSSL